jgi:3-oxoacyl-[acyl-carrier protein] reductase
MFKDKIVLVTGASRGIGRGIAEAFAKQGAIVIGTATSDKGAEQIQNYLQQIGQGEGLVLDVTDKTKCQETFAKIEASYGAPQILVNNAGITRDNLFLRMKEDEWDSVIATNLDAIFHLSKLAVKPMLKARFGRIINISSVVAATGNPGQANYAAAKAGMIGFSKSLAQEIASRNITVNVVAPGFIDTDMTAQFTESQRAALIDQIPANRIGLPADIAHAVLFLASDQASYITGQTLHVNGGMYCN